MKIRLMNPKENKEILREIMQSALGDTFLINSGEEWVPKGDMLVLIAEKEGNPVGFAELSPAKEFYSYVRGLYVRNEAQKGLVAWRLLEAIGNLNKWAGKQYYCGAIRKTNTRILGLANRFPHSQAFQEDKDCIYYKISVNGEVNHVHTH